MRHGFLFLLLTALLLGGCATLRPPSILETLPRLTADIAALGPQVDPDEAERVASSALLQAQALADQYETVSSPHLQNVLVNIGLKERGLCWHYSEDLLSELLTLEVRTLEFHRAVSNAGSVLREHNGIVVTARGAPFTSGILLDPWRKPRHLVWKPVGKDHPHIWRPDLR